MFVSGCAQAWFPYTAYGRRVRLINGPIRLFTNIILLINGIIRSINGIIRLVDHSRIN